jgi:isopenicillin-N N-acyltransferase-like protein
LHEIAALNARYEILYSEYSRIVMEELPRPHPIGEGAAQTRVDGCTAFAVLPEAAADGHLRIGQNWDWIPGVQGLLLHVERPGGFRLLCFTEAGIAGGKIGLNSAGLGLVINGLVSNHDSWARLRTPFHVRTWAVLNSRTLEQATAAILGEERSCSANFIVAAAEGAEDPPLALSPSRPLALSGWRGRAVDLEAAPKTARALEPEGGLLAHANHFLDPDALQIWQPLDERTSTFRRCSRLQHLLAAHRGSLDDERLMAILRDHEGYPQSICTHPSPLWPEEERLQTVFSTVIDLHAGQMLAAAGNPCTHPYERVSLA